MNTLRKPIFHAGLILFLMIVFFPAGLILLIIRFIGHKDYSYLRSKDYAIFRNLFLILAAFFVLLKFAPSSDNTDTTAFTPVFIFCLIIAGFFQIKSRKKIDQIFVRSEHYKTLLYVNRLDSLHAIASVMNLRPEFIKNDFYYLMACGQLQNLHIVEQTGRIVLTDQREVIPPQQQEQEPKQQVATSPPASKKKVSPKSFSCPNCGASTVLYKEEYKECEYCATFLTYS
ncbi:hypothetical protein ACFSTH_01660 [Paenibacillus yanchengensis]|uniref:Zinc ribbon domain-containing protein n=1 Tax=Paenibacillus yanchengensis TaxID=2035833 RepID=A0ABW4YRL8_9BACL